MAQVTRGEINDIIAGFATANPEYRRALMANPKDVLARQMGQQLPDFLQVRVVQDTADTVHLVLPYAPQSGAELSDADLEMVAGGKGVASGESSSEQRYTCNDSSGVATRIEITSSGGAQVG